MIKKIAIGLFSWLLFCSPAHTSTTPKITLVIVVDQLAYETFERVSPYYKNGFKKLRESGLIFTDARHPHGNPTTATGHTTIATGAYAKDHGVVLNSWAEPTGNVVEFGQDQSPTATILTPQTTYTYGYSGHHILTETLSDTLINSSNPEQSFTVYSIAQKPRAAIGMGGKKAQTIWLDEQKKIFTSSNAYMKEIPAWLTGINNHIKEKLSTFSQWKTRYKTQSKAYQFPFARNYVHASQKHSLINYPLAPHRSLGSVESGDAYEEELLYEQTPQANQDITNICAACIDNTPLSPSSNNHLVLWVSYSNFDAIGHLYGHNSLECIDMLYHLDKQIGKLIYHARSKVGKKNTCVVLTADHGCCPIPEIARQQGLLLPQRINTKKLTQEINTMVATEFGIEHIVKTIKNTQLFLNHFNLATVPQEKKMRIISAIKNLIKQTPGVKTCWSKQELDAAHFEPNNLEQCYKNQLHLKRSGDIIIMPYPYTYISKHNKGTGHNTPYRYDTNVPLIMYYPGTINRGKIHSPLYITQLAPTLAHICNVRRPASSLAETLPIPRSYQEITKKLIH